MSRIICVDFDGTLAEHKFPDIGLEVPGAFAVLKELQAAGHRLILWTMRSNFNGDKFLDQAVQWCGEREVEFWGVNDNPQQGTWTNGPKVYAQIYIDDAALGCPLCASTEVDRPMVDWDGVRQHLVDIGVLA